MNERTTTTTQAADLAESRNAELLEWMLSQEVEEVDAEADTRYGWESK